LGSPVLDRRFLRFAHAGDVQRIRVNGEV
jgi:hypothetical protein